jgi:hypothetical protein
MDRLTRAEQRAEQLRNQLVDTQTKQADLQSRLEQTEYAMRPENIERVVQMYGTTRPDEARDVRRKQLEMEKSRLQSQLTTLDTARVRLEQSIATADAQVDLLRQRLDKTLEQDSSRTTVAPVQTTTGGDRTPQPKKPYPDN